MKINEADIGKTIEWGLRNQAEILAVVEKWIWVRKGGNCYTWLREDKAYKLLEPRQKPSEKLYKKLRNQGFTASVLHGFIPPEEGEFIGRLIIAIGEILDSMEEK